MAFEYSEGGNSVEGEQDAFGGSFQSAGKPIPNTDQVVIANSSCFGMSACANSRRRTSAIRWPRIWLKTVHQLQHDRGDHGPTAQSTK